MKQAFLAAIVIPGSILLIASALFISYLIVYRDKIYPNISVAGIKVGGNNSAIATSLISQNTATPPLIDLTYLEQSFTIKGEDIELSIDASTSAQNAYKLTRKGNLFYDLESRILLLLQPANLGLSINLNEENLQKYISVIAGQISVDPINPSVSKSNGDVVVDKGQPGKEVNQDKLIADIKENLSQNIKESIEIPVDNVDNTLSENEAQAFAETARTYLGKTLTIKFEFSPVVLNDSDIFKLLGPHGGYDNDAISALIERVTKSSERDPQNPKFVFSSGKVSEFEPALDGIVVDKDSLKTIIEDNLTTLSASSDKNISFDLPVARTAPKVTTDKVNDLGIKELVGRGTSTYYHSIPGRVHNVSLAASRINGTLVAPGETFSFNNTLGDVSAFTGYQQAYIISEGKTILGDGGGVCQVSSTLFRAVLNAGLPIIERQAHAYRVGYYEQNSPPGLDATVYSPSPDFKFTNDTGNYILIEATADTKNYSLIFELYGTKDGRVVTISKPVVTNVSAPPPDVYQDDSTLPAGTIKQVDYKAWGAKVSFNYFVTKGGLTIINKTFVSNYKPWAAVYLKGTGATVQ